MFKGSTASVIQEALPALIEKDALIIPSTLAFSMPTIPKAMMEKGLWYVDKSATHVHAVKMQNPPSVHFYFLRKDNNLKVTKITKKLIEMYEFCIYVYLQRIDTVSTLVSGICRPD